MSARHKILFVETVGPDPQLAAPYAWFKAYDGFPNITVLRIQFPTWQWSDGAFVDRERRRLTGRISRLFRLYRAHGLIAKVGHTHRYRVTPKGHQIMSTALRFRTANLSQLAA